ncbi:MAG: translation elongation factor Ts [Elusimicrobia bacterium]|nr:translation elongation factor Ts [Elusimicrobiota bacterium]
MVTAQSSLSEKITALRDKTGAGILDCKKAIAESNGDLDKAVEILRKKGLADVAKRAGRTTKEGLICAAVNADCGAMVELNCETDFVAKTADFKNLAAQAAEYVLKNPKADYADDNALKEMVLKIAPKVGENMSLRRAVNYKADKNSVINFYVHMDGKKAAMTEISCDAKLLANKETALNIAKEISLQIVAMSPRWLKKEEVPAEIIAQEKDIYKTQAKNQGKPDAAIEKMLEGRMKKFYEENCLNEQASIRDGKMSVSAYISKLAGEAGGAVSIKRFVRYQLGG